MLSDERSVAARRADAATSTAVDAPPAGGVRRMTVTRAGEPPGGRDPALDRAARTAELDGLRAVAVLLVFLHHAGQVARPLHRYVMPEALLLEAGVEVFFVLSGFLIYSPFARAHLGRGARPRLVDHLRRRALRIYPAYWVAVAVLLALGWVVIKGTPRLVGELTLLQDYSGTGHILSRQGLQPAWTLCVEVSFYAFVPLYAALVRPLGRRWGVVRTELAGALVVIGLGVACLAWANWDDVWGPLSMLFPNLPTLGAGMLLAVVAAARAARPRLDRVARWVPPALVCWPLAFLALFHMPGRPTSWPGAPHEWFVADLTQSLFGLLLALPVLAGTAGLVGRALRFGPVAWVGLVSYGIYLWHYDLLQHLWPDGWQGGRLRAVGTALAVLAVSVALGAASHYLIERPAQAWARRLERRRRPGRSGRSGRSGLPRRLSEAATS
jgi:peptidoglycan/LPS O-acetylase OafA/YrhL